MGAYWSVEQCGWVAAPAGAGLYWSVQRCRWEPVGPEADARATPWSMFRTPELSVPQQRERAAVPVEA